MKKLYVVLAAVLISLIVASVALAGDGGAPRVTTMSGAEEVPPADPDGSGFASIRLNVGQGRVCWELSVAGIDPPAFAAHIHLAPAGVPGPVVVPLSPPTPTSSGCRENVDPALIQAIIDFPEQYYVNVHNMPFPGGAVRGQLSNRGQSD